MRKGQVVAIAVVAFLVATGVLVYLGRDSGTAAAGSTGESGSISGDSASPGMTPSAGSTYAGSDTGDTDGSLASKPDRPASNVPTTILAKDDTAPQFVLFAIDGAASTDQWQQFVTAATQRDARVTAFVGADDLGSQVALLNKAYAAGDDLGAYYDGTVCGRDSFAAKAATTKAWNAKLDQFFDAVDGLQQAGGDSDSAGTAASGTPDGAAGDRPALAFSADDVTGGRIACLHGDLDVTAPAWTQHDMNYDASFNTLTDTGLSWPQRQHGVWEFAVPYAYSSAAARNITVTNGVMWTMFDGADDPSGAADKIRQTYDYLFDQAYQGNRAPLMIRTNVRLPGAASFGKAALGLMADVCGKDDVYCATFADVAAWLGQQDPDVLASWQGEAVATGPSS